MSRYIALNEILSSYPVTKDSPVIEQIKTRLFQLAAIERNADMVGLSLSDKATALIWALEKRLGQRYTELKEGKKRDRTAYSFLLQSADNFIKRFIKQVKANGAQHG